MINPREGFGPFDLDEIDDRTNMEDCCGKNKDVMKYVSIVNIFF